MEGKVETRKSADNTYEYFILWEDNTETHLGHNMVDSAIIRESEHYGKVEWSEEDQVYIVKA